MEREPPNLRLTAADTRPPVPPPLAWRACSLEGSRAGRGSRGSNRSAGPISRRLRGSPPGTSPDSLPSGKGRVAGRFVLRIRKYQTAHKRLGGRAPGPSSFGRASPTGSRNLHLPPAPSTGGTRAPNPTFTRPFRSSILPVGISSRKDGRPKAAPSASGQAAAASAITVALAARR